MPTGATTARIIAELYRLSARCDTSVAEIEEPFFAHPAGELLSILPDIGPRAQTTILAEEGDGSRLADSNKRASFAGPTPVTVLWGKSVSPEPMR